MDTTNQTTPSNANFNGEQSGQENIIPTLSKEVGGELAKECGGSKNLQIVEGDENVLLQKAIKAKVQLFVRELDGFSQWQANHILECVKDELHQLIATYPVKSLDFTICSQP